MPKTFYKSNFVKFEFKQYATLNFKLMNTSPSTKSDVSKSRRIFRSFNWF